jgi:hypothetical protein
MARRSVMLLSVASLKAIEGLAAQIPPDSVVDQPVNKPPLPSITKIFNPQVVDYQI